MYVDRSLVGTRRIRRFSCKPRARVRGYNRCAIVTREDDLFEIEKIQQQKKLKITPSMRIFTAFEVGSSSKSKKSNKQTLLQNQCISCYALNLKFYSAKASCFFFYVYILTVNIVCRDVHAFSFT